MSFVFTRELTDEEIDALSDEEADAYAAWLIEWLHDACDKLERDFASINKRLDYYEAMPCLTCE